jgi:hypothetical protein
MARSRLRTSLLHMTVLAVGGLGIGATLGFVTPPTTVRAGGSCDCSPDSQTSGKYDCPTPHSASCGPGSIKCTTSCQEEQ